MSARYQSANTRQSEGARLESAKRSTSHAEIASSLSYYYERKERGFLGGREGDQEEGEENKKCRDWWTSGIRPATLLFTQRVAIWGEGSTTSTDMISFFSVMIPK